MKVHVHVHHLFLYFFQRHTSRPGNLVWLWCSRPSMESKNIFNFCWFFLLSTTCSAATSNRVTSTVTKMLINRLKISKWLIGSAIWIYILTWLSYVLTVIFKFGYCYYSVVILNLAITSLLFNRSTSNLDTIISPIEL